MAIKCPYCYRPLGTHTHDPILLPDGSPNKWISDTELSLESNIIQRFYRGINQVIETDVVELQTELQTLEINNGIIPLTTFSPLNTSGKFQITGKHIKEMRDSVEKLLTEFNLTKTDYFNYDEEDNHIINPDGDKIEWTDPITVATDLQKFQVKAIHIEDLRHYIRQVKWQERWLYDGTHPEVDQQESFIDYGTLDIHYFANQSIYGDHHWINTDGALSHAGVYYLWGGGPGSFDYHFLQSGGILTLDMNTATTMTGFDVRGNSVFFDMVIGTGVTNNFRNNTKLKITGLTISGSGNYTFVIRFYVNFTKKTLTTINPDGSKVWTTTLLGKDIVLANLVGIEQHYEGEPRFQVVGGLLIFDPATGGPSQVNAVNWYSIADIELSLVDMMNYEYGLSESIIEPDIVGQSYISNIYIGNLKLWSHISATVHTLGGSANSQLQWTIDDIKLI